MKNNDYTREERILGSLDGLQKLPAPDFFYTRLMGRMQKERDAKPAPNFLYRPAFITASLVIVLVFNIFSLNRLNRPSMVKDSVRLEKPATIETFADAYGMNTVSVYE